ncbi:MAG: hypothetical protein AABZ33_11985 [Chloroflexota bacterium]
MAAFLLRTGCTQVVPLGASCPSGQSTNFLGWTVGGLVGSLDGAGLFVLGVLVAVVVYYAIDLFQGRT